MNTEITTTDLFKPCDQCDWRLGECPTGPSLRMHKIRKHGKGWSTIPNLKHARRNRPQGKGKWTPAYRKLKYREQVARYHSMGLNAHGEPFKNSAVSMGMRKSISKRTHYVYPVPQEQQPETPMTAIHFCPNCGENLQAWRKA